MARAAWWCELLTLLLTAVYSAIMAHDLTRTREEDRLSSRTWFQDGFCVSWADQRFNSHNLCFLGDLVGGGLLFLENARRYKVLPGCPELQVAMALSVFTVFHGFGHLMIGEFLDQDFMSTARRPQIPLAIAALHYVSAASLLALGPVIGWHSGVGRWTCVVIHLISTWMFLEFVPTQFGFGFVLLYLNVWFCAPRIVLLGYTSSEEVALRVDHGWAEASYGFLVLMPVVFAEMLACDTFVMSISGHFLYDGAVLLVTVAYCASIWQQLPPGAELLHRNKAMWWGRLLHRRHRRRQGRLRLLDLVHRR